MVRELPVSKTLATLRLLDETDVTAEVALDALLDQYTQNETIKLLEKFIDKLPVYDTAEIKDSLANIILTLDEKTLSTEGVFTMSDVSVFTRPEELSRSRVHLGLNNTFDAVLNGVARQEYILIGGKRGSGKSVVCSNLLVNQYNSGFSSVYFTIEMLAQETLERNMSILAGVNHQKLKNGQLSDDEILKVIKARAAMFTDADNYVAEFIKNRDPYSFEENVNKHCELKPDNQMVLVDDRSLTLSSIDLHCGKMKAKFGDKFTLGIVDYLNQIVLEGSSGMSQYDWQPQVAISKGLKNIARKYDIVIASPYQIDDTGGARFSKGILDAADIALVLEAHNEDNAISMDTTKIRGGKAMSFTSGMNWDTLAMSSVSVDRPASKSKGATDKKDKMPRASKKDEQPDDGKPKEGVHDLPWEG